MELELEEKEIFFTWGTPGASGAGWMRVPLKSFLIERDRGITKAKRLIRYIRESNNPDQEDILKDFIRSFNVAYDRYKFVYDPYMKECERSLHTMECERSLHTMECERSLHTMECELEYKQRYHRTARVSASLDENFKKLQEDIKVLKSRMREHQRLYNKATKDKAFLDKVSDLLE